MQSNSVLLSLCIPTNGIVKWVIPVIDSIYAQGVDNSLFEVVITDNGSETDLSEAVKNYKHENFHYFKTTSPGFTNQIDAFEKCSGVFCKMLNHRSKMLPGSINALLDIILKYKETKPILYCAEGHAKGGKLIECDNVDAFVSSLGVYVSWSAGTGAWREDLCDVRSKRIDKMFPHTVYLLGLRNDSKYVIWNEKYEIMGDESGKGGYNVFQTFAVSFLDILNRLRVDGRIRQETFVEVKKDLFCFLRNLYLLEAILPTKRTFILENIPQSMDVYYGRFYFWKMVLDAWLRLPFVISKKCLARIKKSFCRSEGCS